MPPTSPQDWLTYLEPKLDDQIEQIAEPGAYYDGHHRLAFATQKFREAFARYYAPLANNWMKIVVEAPVSRMEIQGFRFDPDTSKQTWELDADADAWRMWQANNFDAISRMVHVDACKLGVSYVLVAPPDKTDVYNSSPVMTGEHPSQCFTFADPTNPNKRLAAIKRWGDDWDNHAYATVYLPDSITQFRSERPLQSGDAQDVVIFDVSGSPIPSTMNKVVWQQTASAANPIGVVPMIAIVNNPDLLEGGSSDLDTAIPIQDAVNKYCLDMQVSSEYHAYPQRYATGWERAVDDAGHELSSREVELYMAQSRMVRAESHETTFGSFAQGDVNNYILPIELYIDHLAAQTQTPVYYLKGKLANLPLAVDTVVPTPQGRTTMGALEPGDLVYAPDGVETRVAAVSPVYVGSECFRVRFDDGTEIVADGDHRWETTHFRDPAQPYSTRFRGDVRESSIATTREIAATLKTSMGTANHYIPVVEPVRGPAITYPVDPYALGAWLGDGHHQLAEITAHAADAEAMAARLRAGSETVAVLAYAGGDELHADTRKLSLTRDHDRCFYGHERPRSTHRVSHHCKECGRLHHRRRKHGEPMPEKVNTTFKSRLRELGVLGDKHIPEQYFHGSVSQRLELLKGIMDTDGTVTRGQGSVAITLHDERLAADVHRLAMTLGHKVRLRRETWQSRGLGLVSARVGECWRMSWTPHQVVFAMERKARLQKLPVEGGDGRASSPFRRYIVACDRVDSVPVRCITVEHPRHLFCATDAFVSTSNSADAMHAADQGLVDRVKGKILSYSDPWEEFMRTAFLAVNDQKRGHAQSAEVIWADPESKSLAVVVQAAVQMRQALNVPIEMAWELLGWSPQKIRQARDLMNLPPGGPAGAANPPAPALLGPSGQPVSSATYPTQQNAATPRMMAPPMPPVAVGEISQGARVPASQVF